jgi:flagellar biosynthesis protein FliR
MTGVFAEPVFTAFTVFCRIGSAMMLMPGFGSARVPMQVRLLIAVAASLALSPLLYAYVQDLLGNFGESQRLYILLNEVATGAAMGLMARLFLVALQFSATTTANAIGLAGVPGQPIDETEALPPLTNLMSVAGVMALITVGLPEEMLKAVVQSYEALPPRIGLDTQWFLEHVLQVLGDTTLLALRLSAPFIVYAVVVNIAMGLANKFTPQVQMYFASLGLVTMGGLILLFLSGRQMLHVFAEAFSSWLAAN